MAKVVSVKFDGYAYKTYDFFTDLELKVGDVVVVDTQNGLQVAEVVDVDVDSSKATKWVVDKVDMEAHKARIEREKRLKEITQKMEARRKKLEKFEVYRMLAEKDDEMAELLKQYAEVANS